MEVDKPQRDRLIAFFLQEPNQGQQVNNMGAMAAGDFRVIARKPHDDHVIVMSGLFVNLVLQRG